MSTTAFGAQSDGPGAIPLPAPDSTNLDPPDAAEVDRLAASVVDVLVDDATPLTDVQELVLTAVFESMTGHRPTLARGHEAMGLGSLSTMADRNEAFRTRIVQQMILGALLVRPPSHAAVERIREASRRLHVADGMIDIAAEFADGQLELAAIDFDRNGYTGGWGAERTVVLHTSLPVVAAWQQAADDAALAARWAALEDLPEETLGQAVTRFYRARGFQYPGRAGSVSPLLAQHDWVHVLADYGATIDNELEVFAFIARANDDPRGFSFLAMVVSLFESGMLASGAGLFEPDAGHLRIEGMPERLADAMRRGAECTGSIDFLGLDWFELADRPIEDVRAEFGIGPKRAGLRSPGPFEPGGMTSYQLEAGRAAAAARGETHETWGAAP